MRLFALTCTLVMSACVTPPKPKPVDDPQPKPVVIDTARADPQPELHRAVELFVTASESRKFDALHALLSKALRDRYTPAVLARDFDAEPYAKERVARIKAKATEPLTVDGERAWLEWAPGRSLRLIREASSWKIAAVEQNHRMVGVHRWLVEALGDAEAISQIEVDNYLAPEKFGRALERVRLKRFPDLPIWEGAKRVGRQLADAFIDGPNGLMISQSISVMPLDRALESVVLPLSERMRRAAEFDFVPDADGKGGRILVRAAFVVSWATLEGFFGALIARIPGNHTLHIVEQTAASLVFAVRPAGEATPPALSATRPISPE